MSNTTGCCTWNQDTEWGIRQPTVAEHTYIATAGYGAQAYKCVTCTNEQAMELIKKYVPSAGWGGNVAI